MAAPIRAVEFSNAEGLLVQCFISYTGYFESSFREGWNVCQAQDPRTDGEMEPGPPTMLYKTGLSAMFKQRYPVIVHSILNYSNNTQVNIFMFL